MTSGPPDYPTLGESPQRGPEPTKHATVNGGVITEAVTKNADLGAFAADPKPVNADRTADICRLLH